MERGGDTDRLRRIEAFPVIRQSPCCSPRYSRVTTRDHGTVGHAGRVGMGHSGRKEEHPGRIPPWPGTPDEGKPAREPRPPPPHRNHETPGTCSTPEIRHRCDLGRWIGRAGSSDLSLPGRVAVMACAVGGRYVTTIVVGQCGRGAHQRCISDPARTSRPPLLIRGLEADVRRIAADRGRRRGGPGDQPVPHRQYPAR